MNRILKKRLLPSLIATGLIGATFIPANPASADRLLKEVGIGAATGVVSGAILKNGSAVNNAINGAAAGAAVNAANRRRRKNSSLVRDAAIGAAGSTVSGVVTRRGRNSLRNAISGAAAGALINLERRR